MFWNVTLIYNAFIRTTDHCKVQTAFVSLFYIFINMKKWNGSNSSVVVVGLLLFHWKATPTPAFNELLYEFLRIFLISENSLKFANFFCWGNEFSIYVGQYYHIGSEVFFWWFSYWHVQADWYTNVFWQ